MTLSDRLYDKGSTRIRSNLRFRLPRVSSHALALGPDRSRPTGANVAAGTGNADAAITDLVGLSGSVMVTDLSAGMLDRARKRLARLSNGAFAIENGQALSFPEWRFDAVVCGMAIMPPGANGCSKNR